MMRYAIEFSEADCAQALGVNDESSVNEEREWFKFDLDNHKNGRETWFNQLSAAASTILVQWIRILSGFHMAGNVYVEPNRESYSRLLRQIPTPPFANNTYPSFEIENQSIQEWCQLIQSDDIGPISKRDVVLHNIRKDADAVHQIPFPLPPAQLNEAIRHGNLAGQTVSQSVQAAIDTMPIPRFHQQSLDPTRVPLAPQYSPELTPTDLAWINGNSVTKVKITIMIARQELKAWKMFASTSSVQIAAWEKSICELEEMCRLLEEAHGKTDRFDEFAQERTEKEAELSAKVHAAGQHPYTARLLDRKKNACVLPFSLTNARAFSSEM
jgi:hypothetical protein